MTEADRRLWLIKNKFRRGYKHFLDLNIELRAHEEPPDPVTILVARDRDTRRPVWYLSQVKELSSNIPLIIGDVLQCLRSTLDHLVYQLLMAAGVPDTVERSPGFPVAKKRTGFERALRTAREMGMRASAVDALEALEAYEEGKGTLLWTLHDLNNVDKHRLILATYARYRGVDLSGWANEVLASKGAQAKLPPFYIGQVGSPACKANDILHVGEPDEDMDKPRRFNFDIAFTEKGPVEGKPVDPTLRAIARAVGDIATGFYRDGHLA